MKTRFQGIKTAAEYRRGELAKDVLRLIGAGVVVGTVVVAPNAVQLIDFFNPKGRAERNRIWKAIKYLEEKNRVRIREEHGKHIIELTKTGEHELHEQFIWDLIVSPPRFWDKKWRLVMFDFPTHRPDARHAFRQKLEDLGFRMYQRSVFIYPYECGQEILAIAKWFRVEEYVRYVVASEINDMRRFVKEFDLL